MDSKSKILNAALKLFSERGYDAVGVQEIVETAGFSKPTLYHHFGSKLGLYTAIFSHFGAKYINIIEKYTKYENDLTKNLNELTIAILKSLSKDKEFFYFWDIANATRPKSEHHTPISKFNERISTPLVQLFNKATQDHGNLLLTP